MKKSDETENQLLGRMLREQREKSRVTQTEMAEALNVDQPWVSRHESGELKIDFMDVFEYLDVLEVKLSKFSAKFETELKKFRGE